MTSGDKIKKKDRGSFEYKSDGRIDIVRRNDNNVVPFCSNTTGSESVGQAKRWIKGKDKINVTEPAVVRHYNEIMGGVDLVDLLLLEMRQNTGGKNGTRRFF